jgi:hypothetical protein
VVKEGRGSRGFVAAGLVARLDIMQEPIRKELRPLEMSIVVNFN